jgi:hypothetical protein
MMGVNGWYSANQRSPGAIDWGGTKALPRNGRKISGMGLLLAPSGFLAASPSATDTQVRAKATAVTRTTAASHPAPLAAGRKPSSTARPVTRAAAATVRMVLPSTWPVRTDTRAIAMVRNRLMMPSVMSMLTDTAVDTEAELTASTTTPGAR